MRQAIRLAVLAAAAAMAAAACQASGDDPYTVFAGLDPKGPRGDARVRVTVNGEAVTDGTEAVPGGAYRHDFPVEPGQTIVVDVTSKDDEPNCDITQNPGPTQEHLEIDVDRAGRDSSGTWHTTCTWKRPASG